MTNPARGLYTAGIRWLMTGLCSFSGRSCVLLIGLVLFLYDHFPGEALNRSSIEQ